VENPCSRKFSQMEKLQHLTSVPSSPRILVIQLSGKIRLELGRRSSRVHPNNLSGQWIPTHVLRSLCRPDPTPLYHFLNRYPTHKGGFNCVPVQWRFPEVGDSAGRHWSSVTRWHPHPTVAGSLTVVASSKAVSPTSGDDRCCGSCLHCSRSSSIF
jgi:hypothetical protein